MSELVERLRNHQWMLDNPRSTGRQAADEIVRLEQALEEAKELIKNTSTNLDTASYNKALEQAAKLVEVMGRCGRGQIDPSTGAWECRRQENGDYFCHVFGELAAAICEGMKL